MEELEVAVGGPLDGRTVGQLRDEGIFTLAIVAGPNSYEANPRADRVLVAGESLVVSGSADTLRSLRERA
jgi:Trk K+ transport system NAD-binding subunit